MKNLHFHKRRSIPLHRLPFVGGKSERDGLISFFNVPDTGGYFGGCETGDALAWLYLKYIETEGYDRAPCILSKMILDMTAEVNESRRGQIIGFFEILESVLSKLITDNRAHFKKDDAELLAQANAGLNRVEEELGDEEY